MGSLEKYLLICLVVIFVFYSLLIVGLSVAESIPNSQVPQFSLRYVDKSYDVAPTTTTSTDPYTGTVTTTTIPGRHVSNQTIEVTIKNDIDASYYGLRYKGHYSDSWTYFPYYGPDSHNIYDGFFPPDFQTSSSSYTVGYLDLGLLPQPIPKGAPIDVQVQPLFGDFEVTPYGFAIGRPTYDARFKGTVGDWSNILTLTLPSTSVSSTPTGPSTSVFPTPTVPEFTAVAILPLFGLLAFTVMVVLRKRFLKA